MPNTRRYFILLAKKNHIDKIIMFLFPKHHHLFAGNGLVKNCGY